MPRWNLDDISTSTGRSVCMLSGALEMSRSFSFSFSFFVLGQSWESLAPPLSSFFQPLASLICHSFQISPYISRFSHHRPQCISLISWGGHRRDQCCLGAHVNQTGNSLSLSPSFSLFLSACLLSSLTLLYLLLWPWWSRPCRHESIIRLHVWGSDSVFQILCHVFF